MLLVFKQIFLLYIFLFLGWIVGKLKKDKASHSDILSILLVNIFLPCKVFNTFANNFTVSYFREKYYLLIASSVLLAAVSVIAFFLPRLLTKHPYERKIYRYSFTVTNYSYLGYALIEAVFGESVLASFIFFGIPFIIYTYTLGYAMLTGKGNPVKKLLNPITVAIVVGMVFGVFNVPLPDVIGKAVSMGSACVGPLSMILTGMTLSAFAIKELVSDKRAYVFSFLRLLVIPAAVFGVCKLFCLDAVLPMALIITCMPCGLNTIVFPKLVGEDCKLGARLALISHVFSMATLPLWLSTLL